MLSHSLQTVLFVKAFLSPFTSSLEVNTKNINNGTNSSSSSNNETDTSSSLINQSLASSLHFPRMLVSNYASTYCNDTNEDILSFPSSQCSLSDSSKNESIPQTSEHSSVSNPKESVLLSSSLNNSIVEMSQHSFLSPTKESVPSLPSTNDGVSRMSEH